MGWNPVKDVKRAASSVTNLGSRTSVRIGGTSIGINPISQARATLKDVTKTIQQARVDGKNATRGDVGKVASSVGQTYYNALTTVPRTIKGAATGTLNKENQKTLGAYLSNTVGGNSPVGNTFISTLGNSSSAQKALRNDTVKDWTLGLSKNYAGTTRGAVSLSGGKISNADRNDIFQGATKIGLATGAYLGASAALGSSAGAPAGGAVEVSSGGITPLGSSAVVSSSAEVGVSAAAPGLAAATPGAVAAGGTPWYGYVLGAGGAAGLIKHNGSTTVPGFGEVPNISIGDDGGWMDSIGDLLGFGGNSNSGGQSSSGGGYSFNPLPSAVADLLPETPEGKMIMWTGLALAVGIYVWRRRG